MLANHETGAIQPVAQLRSAVPSGWDVAFHCDAAQAAGKIPIDFHELGSTSLSISGHKFGGPAGIGALLVNRCAKLQPLLFGGRQQHGRRPGTEPVALAVGMAAALDAAVRDMQETAERMLTLRRRFLNGLARVAAPFVLNGPDERGLPHVLNVSFLGCRGDGLLMALDLAGVCCSTGSACSSGSLLPSPVLRAMAVSDERLRSALRFSLGPELGTAEIDEAIGRIGNVVKRLRSDPECAA
jgi:cysteine desulfurase